MPQAIPPAPTHLSPAQAGVQAAVVSALALGATILDFVAPPGPAAVSPGPTEGGASAVLPILASGATMLIPIVFFSLRDPDWRRSLGVQRQPLGRVLRDGFVGILLAYAVNILIATTFLLISGQVLEQVKSKLQWVSLFTSIPLIWVLPIALFAGLWEELVFRGFLLGRMRIALSRLPRADLWAVVLTGVLFGLGHVYQGALGVLQTTALGLVFGALTYSRRSLWPAIVAHFGIDAFGLFALRLLQPMFDEVLKTAQ